MVHNIATRSSRYVQLARNGGTTQQHIHWTRGANAIIFKLYGMRTPQCHSSKCTALQYALPPAYISQFTPLGNFNNYHMFDLKLRVATGIASNDDVPVLARWVNFGQMLHNHREYLQKCFVSTPTYLAFRHCTKTRFFKHEVSYFSFIYCLFMNIGRTKNVAQRHHGKRTWCRELHWSAAQRVWS